MECPGRSILDPAETAPVRDPLLHPRSRRSSDRGGADHGPEGGLDAGWLVIGYARRGVLTIAVIGTGTGGTEPSVATGLAQETLRLGSAGRESARTTTAKIGSAPAAAEMLSSGKCHRTSTPTSLIPRGPTTTSPAGRTTSRPAGRQGVERVPGGALDFLHRKAHGGMPSGGAGANRDWPVLLRAYGFAGAPGGQGGVRRYGGSRRCPRAPTGRFNAPPQRRCWWRAGQGAGKGPAPSSTGTPPTAHLRTFFDLGVYGMKRAGESGRRRAGVAGSLSLVRASTADRPCPNQLHRR